MSIIILFKMMFGIRKRFVNTVKLFPLLNRVIVI